MQSKKHQNQLRPSPVSPAWTCTAPPLISASPLAFGRVWWRADEREIAHELLLQQLHARDGVDRFFRFGVCLELHQSVALLRAGGFQSQQKETRWEEL